MKTRLLALASLFVSQSLLASATTDAIQVYDAAKYGVREVGSVIEAVNDVFKTSGVATCSSLPSSGSSEAVTYTNRADLFGTTDPVTIRFEYDTATSAIPTGFPGGGMIYDKKLAVYLSINGSAEEMGGTIELSCSRAAGRVVQTGQRDEDLIVLNWNVDDSSNIYLNYFQATSDAGQPVYAVRFRQQSPSNFTLVAQSNLTTTDLTATKTTVTDNGVGTNSHVVSDDSSFADVSDFSSAWNGTTLSFFD